MKQKHLLLTGIASFALACAAQAQAPFGPWVHDAGVPYSFFVSPTGSNSNSGLDPANAFATLDFAVQQADFFQSVLFSSFPAGCTIQVLPGTYTLTNSLSLPAFGLSIEAYHDPAGGTVTITGNVPSAALFDFDRMVGPQTELEIGLPDGLPPSIVRGLTITNNPNGFAIQIDPSVNATADTSKRTVEVQVNQCTLVQCARGVLIRNQAGIETEYRNQIVDNAIGSCTVGIEAINAWYESDLIRSNRVIGAMTAMRFDGSNAKEAMLHPRILSNTIHNSSFLVGLALTDCSARVVNNTMGFVQVSGGTTNPATIGIFPDGGGSSGERIVIANNILFSPVFTIAGTLTFNPPEIRFGAPFTGALTIESNDFDSSGPLTEPVIAVGPGNVAIANPLFVAAPADLHLTALSPSISNLGNQAFVVPGAGSTITLDGNLVPANCALDLDLDPRTHMQSGVLVDVLHRGSDQFIETAVRLRTATTGPNPLQLADRFGNLPVDGAGNASVDLLLDLPVGSSFILALGAALPMGPEMQHSVVAPHGSLAIDPNSPNGTTFSLVGPTSANPHPFTFNLGTVAPAFTEAEMYLQVMVFLPNGVATFTNRIRIDVDGI